MIITYHNDHFFFTMMRHKSVLQPAIFPPIQSEDVISSVTTGGVWGWCTHVMVVMTVETTVMNEIVVSM